MAINDPFPTASAGGGFDLDAVGAINVAAVPEPAALAALGLLAVSAGRRRK